MSCNMKRSKQEACGPSKDSDQPRHQVLTVSDRHAAANSADPDQNATL